MFIVQATVLKFGDLWKAWKFATNTNFSTISPKLQQLGQKTTVTCLSFGVYYYIQF